MRKVPFVIALTLAVGVLNSCVPKKDHSGRLGQQGRHIVQSIIAANLERESISMGPVWPYKSANFKEGQPSESEYNPATSDEYFADLIACMEIEGISWSDFAGGGIPAARNDKEFRAGGKNAWSYIVYPDEDLPDDIPFMFTKNFRITNDDLRDYTPETSFEKKLDKSVKPLGNQAIIVIQKGSGTQTLPAEYLRDASYFFGSITDDVDLIRKCTVVHPK